MRPIFFILETQNVATACYTHLLKLVMRILWYIKVLSQYKTRSTRLDDDCLVNVILNFSLAGLRPFRAKHAMF